MQARIYQPAKSAMTSGMGKSKIWVLEFAPSLARSIDPLMGWTSSDETQSQVKLKFDSKDAALAYAKKHNIDAMVQDPKKRKANVRMRGYGENFATNRRTVWTH